MADKERPALSAATLAALKDFALSNGVNINEDDEKEADISILDAVSKHFDITEKDDVFDYCYEDNTRKVSYQLRGIKKELGQTLASTGLTVWRAAEHLAQWIFNNPVRFECKRCCELGAGLGLISILLAKMRVCNLPIISTDGDADTVDLLHRNINETKSQEAVTAVILWWGQHQSFFIEYCGSGSLLFDVVIAADVIYEAEQIEPLMDTVCAILHERGEFLLAFARRNVPIDKVLAEAVAKGLQWIIEDEDADCNEHIYKFTWASKHTVKSLPLSGDDTFSIKS